MGRSPRMRTAFKVYVGGLVTVLVAAVWLVLAGRGEAAWWVGNFGTLVWLVSALLWIALRDSRRRWPDAGVLERLANIMTFTR